MLTTSLLLAFLLLSCPAHGAGQPDGHRLHILLITSGNKNLPAFQALERGLDQALEVSAGKNDLFFEFMEGPRFFSPRSEKLFASYLSEKYSHLRFDFIIGWVDQAVGFLLRHPRLFPAAPRIYLEASRRPEAEANGSGPGVKWIEVYDDFAANLLEMTSLISFQTLYVIGDSTSEGALERRLRFSQALARVAPAVRVEYLYDLPLEQLAERLSKAPPAAAAAYYLLMFSDGAGTPMTPYAVLQALSRKSNVPLFSYWESLLGSGIVGGRLMSHRELGEQLGWLLLSSGTNSDHNDIRALKSIYDWNALKHWQIDPAHLPPQAEVINRPGNLLKEHASQVLVVGAVIAGLFVIVLLLTLLLAVRKRSATELAKAYDELEEMVRRRTAELERANRRTTEERQRFFSILEELPGFLYLQAQDYSIAFANKQFKTLFGEHGARPCYEVIQGRSQPCVPCPTFDAFAAGSPRSWQWLRQKTGRIYRIFDYPFTDSDGSPMVLEIGMDITEEQQAKQALEKEARERKRALERLQASERKYRLIFNSAPVGIFKSTAEGALLEANPQMAEIFGYASVAELHEAVRRDGLAATLYADPADRDAFVASLQQVPRKWINFITRYRRKNGEIITCRSQYRAITEGDGRNLVDGFVEDISHREKSQRYLRHYESLVSAIDDMLVFVDLDLRYRQVNDAVVAAFGRSREDIIGRHVEELMGAEFFAQAQPYFSRCLAGEKTVQEIWATFPRRDKAYYRISRYPMREEKSGTLYGIAIVTHDLTATQQAREDLARANEELTRANEELDQFAYVVSHDLKSPLRAIHNYADFLREDLGNTMNEDIQSYLTRMNKAVKRSEELVEDLLAFSRIGRTAFSVEEIDLECLFEEILDNVVRNDDNVVTFPENPPKLTSNRAYLMQILQNLISNGLKFNTSRPRKVEVAIAVLNDVCYEFKVSDNGIGINPGYQEQIFKVFTRLHTSEEFEGTGIGLALVRKAAEVLGGTVGVHSAEGEGSVFTVRLPADQQGTGMEAGRR